MKIAAFIAGNGKVKMIYKYHLYLQTLDWQNMEPKTSLELILILAARHQDKQSIKKLLQHCGPEKFETYDKSLAVMSNEKLYKLYLNGLAVTALTANHMISVCE